MDYDHGTFVSHKKKMLIVTSQGWITMAYCLYKYLQI